MIQLRDYQLDRRGIAGIRAAFREHERVLYQLPTGGGKTVMFCQMTHNHVERRENAHVLILVHRAELVDQCVRTLQAVGERPGIIDAEHRAVPGGRVAVGSVFSVAKRLPTLRVPTLLIVDECHHAAAGSTWDRIALFYRGTPTLGVTATPCRLDGRGLADSFETLICGPSTAELVGMGYLAKPVVYAPSTIDTTEVSRRMGDFARDQLVKAANKPKITGDAIEHYIRLGSGAQGIAFCVSVAHAEDVAHQFRAAGINSVSIDGSMDHTRRAAIIEDFRDGRLKVLTSCDLISEGFDVPAAGVGIMLRPTQSLGLWLQQCGRVLRPSPGKSRALILDHAGNALRHGLPDESREWSLDGSARTLRKADAGALPARVRLCRNCLAASPSTAISCNQCKTPFDTKPRVVRKAKGELKELTPEQAKALMERRRMRQMQGFSRSLDDLIALGKQRGYKDPLGWAKHVYQGRAAK